jgi:hypothetical protein
MNHSSALKFIIYLTINYLLSFSLERKERKVQDCRTLYGAPWQGVSSWLALQPGALLKVVVLTTSFHVCAQTHSNHFKAEAAEG